MMKVALLVVDMQNDFIIGSLALKDCPAKQDGQDILETVNQLVTLPSWDLIVYSQDWHPPDHISFVTNAYKFEQHEDSSVDPTVAEVYDKLVFNIDGHKRREQIMWPPHCIQTTWGAQFHKDLTIANGSHIVKKGLNKHVDSYSAFFDNQRLEETEMRELLQRNGITHVFVCGVATDICVNFTIQDSIDLGFKTYFIEDACAGVNCDHIHVEVGNMVQRGAHVVQSTEVKNQLEILHGNKPVKEPENNDEIPQN